MRFSNSKSAGFGRLGCFGLIITIGLLVAGGQGIYVAARNREPTSLELADYIKNKPTAEWLILRNCVLNVAGAAYMIEKGSSTPTQLFIPVIIDQKNTDEKVHVLLATKDKNLIATVMELELQMSKTAVMNWLSKNRERAFVKRNITGLVQFGIEQKVSDRRKLANLQGDLAKDFIIIKDGSEPDLMISSGMFAGGILLAIFMFKRSGEESEESED
jgi:hypothetical protein